MGLFQRQTTSGTRAWRAGVDDPLELDLDRHALAGIALRDPAALLWKLGPPDDPAGAANGFHDYAAAGAAAETSRGQVSAWRVFWRDPSGRFAPFTGPCRYRNAPVELRAGLEASAIVRLFGEPLWRDEGGDETRLFYARHAFEWQVNCTASRGLWGMVLSAMPLYAGQSPSSPT